MYLLCNCKLEIFLQSSRGGSSDIGNTTVCGNCQGKRNNNQLVVHWVVRWLAATTAAKQLQELKEIKQQ